MAFANRTFVTRLAPSPTGALHLGNARTFLLNWILARDLNASVVLRIDDIDGPRLKAGADRQAIADLEWLGLTYDAGPVYQSQNVQLHRQAIERLIGLRRAYPCICSRSDIDRAASAPHADDGSAVYPGTCRDRFGTIEEARRFLSNATAPWREPSIRFDTRGCNIRFSDRFVGEIEIDVANRLGDFVIQKSDGTPSYQLATVIDDASAGVNLVVRGDDLLDSTPRQIALYQALDLADRIPTYIHLPLVVGPDGRRLAKRHGDTRISRYRDLGVRPERIIALLARRSGIELSDSEGSGVSASDLIGRFDLARLPRTPMVIDDAVEKWLRNR
jgi:glutamyl-tRNA synthetase